MPAAAVAPAASQRVLTIPNVITMVRLAMVPVFAWLLLGADLPVAAGIVLGALGATDWVDGFLARRLHQVSELGKVLDPVVDRVALIVGLVAVLIDGSMPRWLAVAILLRELAVAGMSLWFTKKGAEPIPVLRIGKAATFATYVSVPCFLAVAGNGGIGWDIAAWAFGIGGLTLGVVAAVAYVPRWRAALAASRRSAPAAPAPDRDSPPPTPRTAGTP